MWTWPVTMNEWQDTCHSIMRGSHLHLSLSCPHCTHPPLHHTLTHTHTPAYIAPPPPRASPPPPSIHTTMSTLTMTIPPLCLRHGNNNKTTCSQTPVMRSPFESINILFYKWGNVEVLSVDTSCKLYFHFNMDVVLNWLTATVRLLGQLRKHRE